MAGGAGGYPSYPSENFPGAGNVDVGGGFGGGGNGFASSAEQLGALASQAALLRQLQAVKAQLQRTRMGMNSAEATSAACAARTGGHVYSTFAGTQAYIQKKRAPRLEMWQALMQVRCSAAQWGVMFASVANVASAWCGVCAHPVLFITR
jgi:hypothetical protein